MEPIFTDLETQRLRLDLVELLATTEFATSDLSVPEEQPFLLPLLQKVAGFAGDPDTQIVAELIQRVPLGYYEKLPISGIWPRALPSEADEDIQLELCEGNWLSAEQDPQRTLELVLQDLQDGYVREWQGSWLDAHVHWPSGVAKGKLGVQRHEFTHEFGISCFYKGR